jgi:Icc-related predicted phosphoesterase
MRIIALSDTHRTHTDYTEILRSLGGDVLIHAGDSDCYDENTTRTFLNWCKLVAPIYKHGMLLTFGNHDTWAADNLDEVEDMLEGSGVRLLINQSIEIEGISFWLSPYSLATSRTWNAFTLPEGELAKVWAQMPETTDVVVTHTPAHSVLDKGHGSKSLIERLEAIKPRLHICGHIHEYHGSEARDGITYVNAATVGTVDRGPWFPAIIDLEPDKVVVESPYEMDVT